MTDEHWIRLRRLFDEASALPRSEHAGFLDRELGDAPELRAELEALLNSSDASGEFLADPHVPEAGTVIGSYRLVEVLGEGGFGVVYLAEQEHPIRRQVALKLVKPGMDTRQVLARFASERQALALMDHPGIAHVFEAGETDAGRPYFAMEYVPGLPITAFADAERLSLRDRLELFLQACDAVQHAHQKGVIHRDIKPSNVLVARRDGTAAVRVIDFGTAKATGEARVDGATMTKEGTVIGTAGYMSPEQLGAVAAPVDTRTDIYSLGALLYELLAGDLPVDRIRLRTASWLDTVKLLLEDPTPPAVRVSRVDTGEIARNRSTDARTLVRSLRGELEWITLKALEREPERRYSSASELAADIRRHLDHEPVMAAAPGTLYRLRKYARRHRVGVTAAALVFLAVVAGGIAATVGFGRAVRAERAARREAESSKQVADFLVGLFHASSPGGAGDSLTVRQLLDEGTRRIEADTTADARVRARLLGAISDSYLNLTEFDEGLRLTRKALAVTESARPRDDVEVARYLDKLANAFSMAGRPDSIAAPVDRALALLRGAPTGDPALLAMLLYRKGRLAMEASDVAAADSLLDLAIATGESVPDPDASMLSRAYGQKGVLANWKMELEAGEAAYRKAIEFARQAGETMREAGLHGQISRICAALGHSDEALDEARLGLDLARKIYPPGHPFIVSPLSAMADALAGVERYAEAIAAQEEAIGILRARVTRGEQLAYELCILADHYDKGGRNGDAVSAMVEALALYRADLGPDHFRNGEAMANLARYHVNAGRSGAADSLFRDAIAVFDRVNDRTILSPLARRDHGNLCLDLGRYAEAETLFVQALAALDSSNTGTRPFHGECLMGRARILARAGQAAAAESLMAAAFRMRRGEAPENDPDLVDAWLCWVSVRWLSGDAPGAIETLRAAVTSGAGKDDVARYPELQAMRSRPDYPLDNSP